MMTSTGLVPPPGRGSECREDICRSLFSLADTDGDGLVWRSVVSISDGGCGVVMMSSRYTDLDPLQLMQSRYWRLHDGVWVIISPGRGTLYLVHTLPHNADHDIK